MAIDFDKKIDLLWKKINFGVSETSLTKQPYEENEKSSINFFSSDIWQEDHLIPEIPAEVPGIVSYTDIEMVKDLTDPNGNTFLSVINPATPVTDDNRYREFIPFNKSPLYEIKVYSDIERTVRMYPNDANNEWVFDYSAGILWFPNGTEYNRVFLSGYRYVGKKGVGPIFTGDTVEVIMEPTSGSYTGGYLNYFVSNQTTIADAVDGLNRALNDFVPLGPLPISSFNISVPATATTFEDARIVLAEGYDIGVITGDVPQAGSEIDKLIGTKIETLPFGPFGNGNSGFLSMRHNDNFVSNVTLTADDNTGTYGYIQIMSDVTIPDQFPGFKQGVVARAIDLTATDYLNNLSFIHSQTGETQTLFVYRETETTLPTVNEAAVEYVEDTGSIEMSSGIPHYGRGTQFKLSASVADLATNLTLSTKNVEFSTKNTVVGANVFAVPGNHNLPAILEKGVGYDIENVVFQVEDSDDVIAHGSVRFYAHARNANGYFDYEIPTDVNVMRGTEFNMDATPVQEIGIPVVDMGELIEGTPLFAERILLTAGRYPAWLYGTDLPTSWNPIEETTPFEASIVGGTIAFDKTDYSTWLPAGPNYSTKDDTQYITFAIRRAEVSNFIIEVEGRYTGVYIKLPETGDYPYVVNGWIDGSKEYVGYGTPGKDVEDGCAVGKASFGGTQSLRVTFGEESSSSSVNNLILVRFEMTQDDVITGLRFVGV